MTPVTIFIYSCGIFTVCNIPSIERDAELLQEFPGLFVLRLVFSFSPRVVETPLTTLTTWSDRGEMGERDGGIK